MTDLEALRAELADFARPEPERTLSAEEERLIAGFEEVQRFVMDHGHPPRHGEDLDIFERLYALRLDRLRGLESALSLLLPLDHQGLLSDHDAEVPGETGESLSDDELLAELEGATGRGGIRELRHVRSAAEKRAAEEIAGREECEDFERFRPIFERVEGELRAGTREARRFVRDASVEEGDLFILNGQLVYVAHVGETIKAPNGENDARLRVIYSNGTESDLLRRSLQRALYKDVAGRRITDPDIGPLFSSVVEDGDVESGTIYVLRSRSDHPYIAEHRQLIHKIGVTGGRVEARIAGAERDPTYLLAGVDIVATYRLHNLNSARLEKLFHRLFGAMQIDLTIRDRFDNPVKPREWFLVPLTVIDEAVQRLRDGTITGVVYDPGTASFREADPTKV